jgi:pilus assembly protein CpaF
MDDTLTLDECIDLVITQFTRYNQTGINCVNKGAMTLESFKQDVYSFMDSRVPAEFQDICWDELQAAAWNYDIIKPLIYDDGAISDIVIHAWNNVWINTRGQWSEWSKHFRNEDHYLRFFNHVCFMTGTVVNENNACENCTDIYTCPDFRLRINFVHKSINTDGNNVLSFRKIPTHKKLLNDLTSPEEGMLTGDMLPIIHKHISEATGILICGMSGSGKTTFLNALVEELPKNWKYLFIQENEELYSDTRRNSDFLRTVKGINQYDVKHDLKEIARQALLMSIQCCVVGETKGGEALYLLNIMTNGALGITTAHTDSAEHGLTKIADYVKYESDYTQDQCLQMLTAMNKVFFLKDYRLREITTVHGYDSEKHQLIMSTEHYNPNPRV